VYACVYVCVCHWPVCNLLSVLLPLSLPPLHTHRPCAPSYAEAAKMKQKADELQAWEEEKLEAQWQAEMYQKELRFKQKLKAELVALKQRIASGSAEQKRQRQVDTERCVRVDGRVGGVGGWGGGCVLAAARRWAWPRWVDTDV
jgi:hypothetical protein